VPWFHPTCSPASGVFRCATDGTDWKHALSEVETFTVFVRPHDPNLVFAGTADGVYRSTGRGQNFRRADFPDRSVQVWSFLHDDADRSWVEMPLPHGVQHINALACG
jgi:hypothetical protein